MTTPEIPKAAIPQATPPQPTAATGRNRDAQSVRIFRCADFSAIVERVSGDALTWDKVNGEFNEVVAS
ncbi:MAG: hypothetical protein V3S28_01655 [Acidimicrobiia bacterium]